MDDLTTERSFDLQATWVIHVLVLFFNMLSTNRHCRTSGRLVQELNVCTLDPFKDPKRVCGVLSDLRVIRVCRDIR